MVTQKSYKGTIGILTGGGDVPGLNPAIRAITIRANSEGYRVIGIRRGWAGLVDIVREQDADNSECTTLLTNQVVNKVARTGGTFLHSSRTNITRVPKEAVPSHLNDKYNKPTNDLTPEVLKNLEFLGIDILIVIGGDDTLSCAVRLNDEGVNIIGIPKTMDNDVPGTNYCIGFSTCLTRTMDLVYQLRTCAGSHERILVVETFGRYAGFTALLPTMAGAADRCVIPEHKFDIHKLVELLVHDRNNHRSKYSVVIVSEGAMFEGQTDMVYQDEQQDAYGHKKLGGIGDRVAAKIRELSPNFNNGKKINTISQRLGYLVRSGMPDFLDSIVPMAFANLALDLIEENRFGRLVAIQDGKYADIAIETVTANKKFVNVDKYYNTERYRPNYEGFSNLPMMIMTSDI